jgi:hypothetical protein
MVPSVEVLREMSDSELMRLRTDVAADLALIQGQIRYGDDGKDDEWRHRTGMAAHYREQGLRTIKNILAERHEHRQVALSSWLKCLTCVADAAVEVLDKYEYDAETEPEYATLENAVKLYQSFTVSAQITVDS